MCNDELDIAILKHSLLRRSFRVEMGTIGFQRVEMSNELC